MDADVCLILVHLVEAGPAFAGDLIVEHGVPVTEGASFHILTGQPNGISFQKQRPVGKKLGGAPVDFG